jgi:hypothetical protein
VITAVITAVLAGYFGAFFHDRFSRPPNCTYPYGSTDDAALRWLIRNEGVAVQERSIGLIREIFDAGAYIEDVAAQREWDDPIARYEALFRLSRYPLASHSDYEQVEIADRTARYRSASAGLLLDADSNAHYYSNPPGSDEWVFGRNGRGCWVITTFRFNVGG